MTTRMLTKAEAKAISADEDADFGPSRKINATGKAAMVAFVTENATDPERHYMEAWFMEAEKIANEDSGAETVTVEMNWYDTTRKFTATVRLDADCFDWVLVTP